MSLLGTPGTADIIFYRGMIWIFCYLVLNLAKSGQFNWEQWIFLELINMFYSIQKRVYDFLTGWQVFQKKNWKYFCYRNYLDWPDWFSELSQTATKTLFRPNFLRSRQVLGEKNMPKVHYSLSSRIHKGQNLSVRKI